MGNIIDKLLKVGFDLEEAQIFDYLTCHIQEGSVTTQVPLIEIGFTEPTYIHIDFKKLFDENYVIWSTDKGVIRTEDCRNPETKRLISGFIYMSADYVEKHFDLMYDIFCNSGVNETTVTDKKEFLALIVTHTLCQKAPKGKEKISDQYLKLCEKLFPQEDIVNDRLNKFCPEAKKFKMK